MSEPSGPGRSIFVYATRWAKRATGVEDPGSQYGAAVLLERHAILVQQVPIMYSVVLVNVATLAIMASASTSPVTWLLLPVALSLVVGRRLIFYARNRSVGVTPEDAAAQQQVMVFRTVLLSVGYVAWVVSILGSGNLAQDAIAAMLAHVSALGSAYCMATLPVAARAAVLLAPTTVASFLLLSDKPLLIGLATNLVLAAVLALRLLTRHHLAFVEGVRSRLLLAEEGARARAAEDAAARLARTDALTGLLNRRGLLEQLAERSSFGGDAKQFGLALLDLNGFKAVNDSHGHATGDELLALVAYRLEALAGEGVVVARLGGDEFALLIDGGPDIGSALRVMQTLSEAIAKPFQLSPHLSVSISAGYGLAFFPSDETDPSRLLALADCRLYACKRTMRNMATGIVSAPAGLGRPRGRSGEDAVKATGQLLS